MSRKGRGGKKKTSLPAFGFAEDLLKGGAAGEPEGGEPEGGEPEGGEPEGGEQVAGKADPEKTTTASKAKGKTSTRKAASRKAKPAPQQTDAGSPDAPETGRRASLPAFGFAADVLGERKKAVSESAATSATDDGESVSGSETVSGSDETEGSGFEESGRRTRGGNRGRDRHGLTRDENRIFAFADSLEAAEEEEKRRPVRLETWVTFTLAEETFALPVEPVREILRISTITRVPHAPHPIRGVTNLRGRVIPVIDLRVRIELPEGELSKSSRIIVVGSRNRLMGLLVDGVHQVVHLDVDRVQPPPEDVMTIQSDYISGVYQTDHQLLLLLDVDRALIIRESLPAGEAAHGGSTGILAGDAEA